MGGTRESTGVTIHDAVTTDGAVYLITASNGENATARLTAYKRPR